MSTAAQCLHALATKQFATLTPAEELLLHRVADGEEAHYETPPDADNDLRQADTWGPERTIHAAVLRWLCVDRNAIQHVDSKGLSIHGARIDGALDLRMVTIPFPLFLVRCALREPINLEWAEMRVLGLNGSTTQTIHGRGLVVHGDLRLQDGFDAQGKVDLINATIGGDLDCSGGVFHHASETALQANGAKIDGAVLLRQGFQAEGEVSLHGATIGRDLDCSGGVFHHAGKIALTADGVKIDGHVLLREGFRAEGLVIFSAARIQQHLDCNGASFSGAAPNGLMGEGLVVGRALDWRQVTTNAATILDLAGAQVGQLADDEASWVGSEDHSSKHLDLDGFIYGAIFDGPTDAKTRLRWLARQTPVDLFLFEWQQAGPPPRPFRPHPYQQLAKVLRERGQDADAKRVLIAKEKARRTHGNLGWWARQWNGFLGFSMAYGYRPQQLLVGALVFVLLGWAVFAAGDHARAMIPTNKEAYTIYEATGQVPVFYPRFRPFMYSLDTFVPIINFGQKDHWRPRDTRPAAVVPQRSPLVEFAGATFSSSPRFVSAVERSATGVTSSSFLRVYRWIHIGIGWLLITLGIAGVTGLVRKE